MPAVHVHPPICVSDCVSVAGELDSDVFIKYLKSVSPVYPGLDGRIQFLEGGEECDTNAGSPSSSSLSVLLVCLAWIYVHCGQ